jgi:hypothetical protein
MKIRIQSLWLIAAGLVLSLAFFGVQLSAQTEPSSSQQTQPPAGQPDQGTPTQPTAQSPDAGQTAQPDAAGQTAQPGQATGQAGQATPDSSTQAPDAAGGQTFTGTVVKAGDKYVLQDSASGTSYDIDHQEQVKQYEGKRVRVVGTLDPATKTIHIK